MKKIISLLLAGAIAILPISAYAAEEKKISVEDVLNADYDYRWTVEAELDETYSDTWLYGLADDGKIEITFAETNENLFDSNNNERSDRWVIAFKGNQGEYVSPISSENEYVDVQQKYIDDGEKEFNLYMYKRGSSWEMLKDSYGYFAMNIGEYPTPIIVYGDEISKAEDTSLNLCDRDEIYNYKQTEQPPDLALMRKFYMQEHGIEGNSYLILAKAVTREDMKKPTISDENYLAACESSTYAMLNYDKPVEELIHSEENKWLKEHKNDDSYAAIILDGTYGDNYYRAFEDGSLSFELNLPIEFVSEVSSDGNVKIDLQRYENFEVNKAFPGAFYEKNYGERYGRKEHEYYKLMTLSGNLGLVQYLADTESGYFKGEADYAELALYPVTESDDTVIAARKTDENSNSLKAPIELYIEYVKDMSFCGIEKVGIKAGEAIYSISADKAVIDFDAEVGLSARYVGSAASRLIRNLREARSINNSTNGSLTKENLKNPIKVYAKNAEINFGDCEPLIKDGRILVPMRAIFEALGATVEWSEETQTVTATKGNVVITLQIGKNEIVKNGETSELDTEAQIVNDRTLVPLRAVSESFDNKVEWNGEEKTVTILTDKG